MHVYKTSTVYVQGQVFLIFGWTWWIARAIYAMFISLVSRTWSSHSMFLRCWRSWLVEWWSVLRILRFHGFHHPVSVNPHGTACARGGHAHRVDDVNVLCRVFASTRIGITTPDSRCRCRTFKVQREFVSPLQVTHLPPVWGILLPLA